MKDLVEKLRDLENWRYGHEARDLMKLAADEIERLRRELRAAISRASYHCD